ncbi:MAG: hypothetical protein ACK2T7_07770 [Anaerolineales bacterium]
MSGRKSGSGGIFLGLVSSLFMLGAVLLLAYFAYTFANPYHALNPFQPPTPTAAQQSAVEEPAKDPASDPAEQPAEDPQSDPTAAPTLPAPPTETPLPLPTNTPFPTATPVVINTPVKTPTLEPVEKFTAQEGTPSYIPYSGGCSGLYVAGNITDIDHNPVMLMTVRAVGNLDGEEIFIEVLSGSNTDYTISGWEIKLSDTLVSSSGSITISLYQQGGWEPISEEVLIDTYNDCSRNLAVVNFVQK